MYVTIAPNKIPAKAATTIPPAKAPLEYSFDTEVGMDAKA